MIDISWGSLGLKDKYMLWLKRKFIVSILTTLSILFGSFGLILGAFETQLNGTFFVFLAAWSVWMLVLGIYLTYVNRGLHGIEHFLGFYKFRYEVRHQEFCTNEIHCAGLHPFNRIEKHP